MNELLQKLNTAHRVCVEIEQHYTAINDLQHQAAHLANIQRNTGISAVADVVTAAINISNS